LAINQRLQEIVTLKLVENWSPEQVAGWLKAEFPDDEGMRVSAETIYRSLFLQARGALKRELLAHLRSRRVLRRARNAPGPGFHGRRFPDSILIRARPAEVEDRAVPGHWEGDLLFGCRNSQIATLVERHTRFTMLVKLRNRDTSSVVRALARKMGKLPNELRRSLTWDQGKEITDHARFTLATDMKVFICDPHSPWQRGTNENTNGLLRQYFPKGSDISQFTQAHLDRVALQLNQRPRKTLGFATPAQKLQAVLQ
jgi:IS30 family transposase